LKAKKKYRTLFDSSADAISIIDLDTGKFIECNKAAVKLHGTVTRENFLGLTPEQLSPKFQPNGVLSSKLSEKYIQMAFKKGVKVFEWNHLRSDGTPFPTIVTLSAMTLGEKNLVLAFWKDITQLKQVEDTLRQSEEKFKNLVEYSNDWIWEVNAEGIYTYSSPLVEEMLGYKPEEIIGKTPFNLMPPEEAMRQSKIFKDISEKGGLIVSLENINQHKNGQLIILETSGVPVFDEAGNLTHYRGVDRDITKRKQAEEGQEKLITELQEALENVKTLSGLLPICAQCKKIRDDKGYWNQIEAHIQKHSNAEFSHSICPECSDELYGNEDWYSEMQRDK
jgi:PAS domain S-box-containing protein